MGWPLSTLSIPVPSRRVKYPVPYPPCGFDYFYPSKFSKSVSNIYICTYGPNDTSGVVWAFMNRRCPTQPSRCIYNIYTTYIDIKKQVSIKTKKNVPLAETTHLASFGPSKFIAAQRNPPGAYKTYIESI